MISMQLNMERSDFNRNMLARAVKLSLANELEIPFPNKAQFNKYVSERPAFMDFRTGGFSQSRYTQFLDMLKNNARLSEETLIDTLNQDWRMAQVDAALGGPGYVLPYEAVEEIKRKDTTWSVDIAELDRDNFKPEITVDEEKLQAFYEKNKTSYETAPMVDAEFVLFEADDFVEQVGEPSQEQLQQYYNMNRAQWPKDDEGKTQPLDTIEDVVAAKWKNEQAKQLAVNEANQLAVDLYDAAYQGKVKRTGDSLKTFLAGRGETLEPLPPFSQMEIPADAPLPASALRQAIQQASGDRFYTDGITTDNGGAIIVVRGLSETRIPPLSEIRDRVVTDYKAAEEQTQFNLASQENLKKLRTAVKDGKNFVEEAKALGMTVDSYDDFNILDAPEGIDPPELSVMETLSQGDLGNLARYSDPSTIIYVRKRDIPEVSADSEEVKNLISQLNSRAAQATRETTINDLISIGDEKLNPPTM